MENHPTRVPSNNPNLYRWKNWEEQTPFAPSFDIPVYIDNYDTSFSIDLANLIDRDQCRFNHKDYNWLSYNIFDWGDDIIKTLADKIYQTYSEYNNELGYVCVSKDQLWIRGWGVVMKEGNFIKHHSHGFHENSYLSGNLSLSEIGTTTDYYFPYLGWYFGYWKVKNSIGSLSMFPSWLEHKVDVISKPKVRYTVAFDLYTSSSIDYARKNRNKSSEIQNSLLLSKLFSEI